MACFPHSALQEKEIQHKHFQEVQFRFCLLKQLQKYSNNYNKVKETYIWTFVHWLQQLFTGQQHMMMFVFLITAMQTVPKLELRDPQESVDISCLLKHYISKEINENPLKWFSGKASH